MMNLSVDDVVRCEQPGCPNHLRCASCSEPIRYHASDPVVHVGCAIADDVETNGLHVHCECFSLVADKLMADVVARYGPDAEEKVEVPEA